MKKAKIFVIEDSPDTVLQLRIYLNKSFNCDLTFAHSGDDAIEILKKEYAFDVIICDFMMSPGTGLDVLNFIKDSGIKIPFILYSSHARDLQSYKSETCRAVIDKMKVDDLTKLVGEIIGQEEKAW